MADSATIVAASLDSSQLEQSINKLVSMVAEKTKAMADNFTKEVGRMEQAVKNLGNIKIDSGGAADGDGGLVDVPLCAGKPFRCAG